MSSEKASICLGCKQFVQQCTCKPVAFPPIPRATHCAKCGGPLPRHGGAIARTRSGMELGWCSPECFEAAVLLSNPSFRPKKGTLPEGG
jgi:hypothetical protein